MSEETTNQEETLQETVESQTEVQQEVAQDDVPKNVSVDEDGTIKIDLRQQPETQQEDAIQKQETTSVDVGERTTNSEEVDEEVRADNDESPVVELVQDEEVENVQETILADKIKDIPNKLKEQEEDVSNTRELPENVDKLISFMEETGGTLEDYISLNKDYGAMEDMEVLREHYRKSKPHLDESEINF